MNITYGPIDKWPRDMTKYRKRSPFKATYGATMSLLERELRLAGARTAVVQLALDRGQFRISDGKPYANAQPVHPAYEHAQIEQLTQMLCYAMTLWEAGETLRTALAGRPVLRTWWSTHKAADDMRAARDAAEREAERHRQAGLAKLSREERAALGLNR